MMYFVENADIKKVCKIINQSTRDLEHAAVKKMQSDSVKKYPLFERSEFGYFRKRFVFLGGGFAVLNFCFFCFKTKEKDCFASLVMTVR